MFKYTDKLLALSFIAFSVHAQATQVIPIYSCDQLQNMGANLSAQYYLANDLDCEGADFASITGTFKGQLSGKDQYGKKHIIRNIQIHAKPNANGGLFANVEGAIISDIRFENISVYSDDNTSRGLIGGRISKSTVPLNLLKSVHI